MTVPADGSTVTEPIANGGVTPEMKQEFQKVVMGILKDAMPRMIKQSLTEVLPSVIEQVGTATRPVETKPDPNTGDQAAIWQKKFNEQDQQIKKFKEEIEQKENARVDALTRSQVRESFAKTFGADHPDLGTLMDSYYDVRKRFATADDGSARVRFKSEYGGDDELVPLDEGMKRLAEKELKHHLPSKTGNLPIVPGARRGNPVAPNGNSGPNAFDRVVNDIFASVQSADSTQK